VFQLSGVQARGIAGLVKESQGLLLTPEERLSSLAPTRSALIGKGDGVESESRRHGFHRAHVWWIHEAEHAGERLAL